MIFLNLTSIKCTVARGYKNADRMDIFPLLTNLAIIPQEIVGIFSKTFWNSETLRIAIKNREKKIGKIISDDEKEKIKKNLFMLVIILIFFVLIILYMSLDL